MIKHLALLNKAGFMLAAVTISLLALAYQPVSGIFSTSNSGQDCSVGGSGRTVVSTDVTLFANSNPTSVGPLNVSIPAGQYNIYWQSFDAHSVHGGQNQQQEQWYIEGLRGGATQWISVTTPDLPENQDVNSGLLQANVTLPQLDSVTLRHAGGPGTQSITPSCVSFENVTPPPPPPPPVAPKCELPSASGRIINTSRIQLLANGLRQIGPFDINLPAGEYNIQWQSFDAHSVHGGQNQQQEIWEIVYIKNGVEVGTSPATLDIPENVDSRTGTFTGQIVPMADQVIFRHAAGTNVGPQSVVPTCVSFDKQPDPVVTCNSLSRVKLSDTRFRFTADASASNGATISSYTFDFGDGNSDTVASNTTTHTYAGDGTYDVRVTVNSSLGSVTSGACTVRVTVKTPPPPVVMCDRLTATRLGNGLVKFTADATASNGAVINGYTFDFGDGNSTSQAGNMVEHTYQNDGTYNAKVTVNGSTGNITSADCRDTVRIKITPELATLGDRVWLDANNNGVQDAGEQNVPNVRVQLRNQAGTVIATQFTNGTGNYLFDNLDPGTYSVRFALPDGFAFTTANTGGDDALDSDANVDNGTTASVTLAPGETNRTVDAGLVEVKQPVFRCDAIRINEIADRQFRVNARFTVEDTTVERYLFTIFSETGVQTVSRSNPNFGFSVTEAGNYVVTAQVVTADGTSRIGQCRERVTVDPVVDLELKKWVTFGNDGPKDANDKESAPVGTVGSDAQWTIRVRNQGPDTATGVEVTDLLPAGVTYVTHATATGNFNSSNAVWTIGTLAPGETVELRVVTTVDEVGTITNWAGVTATNETDVDSTPDDKIDGNEDDEDLAIICSQEPEVAALGDKVWIDVNGNGIQDSNEPGIDNVVVILQTPDGTELDSQNTSGGGMYLFDGLTPGDYKVTFELPSGFTFTTAGQGLEAEDSDANVTTGMSDIVTLVAGETNLDVDAGLLVEETEDPIARCVALNVVKLTDRSFRFELVELTRDAVATNYSFSVNGAVVKTGEDNTMQFDIVNSGSYTIAGQITFDIDGQPIKVDCSETVIDIGESGQVLGTVATPTILPNTGPGALLGMMGAGLAAFAARAWMVSRKDLASSLHG